MASGLGNPLASVLDVCSFCHASEGQEPLDGRCAKRAIYCNTSLCGSCSPLPGHTVCAWVSQAAIKAQALWHRSEGLLTPALHCHFWSLKSRSPPSPGKVLVYRPPPPLPKAVSHFSSSTFTPSHLGYCPPISPFMLLMLLLCYVVFLVWKGQRARLRETGWTHVFHMFSSSSLILLL